MSSFPFGDVAAFLPGQGGAVLQLSMRRVHDLVAFCAPYEFEDVVAEVTGADRIEVTNYPSVEMVRRVYKLWRKVLGSRRVARALTPALPVPSLSREYELFFPVFNHPFELFALAAVPDWRARSRVAACFISELWIQELPEYLIELLAEFDHVFIAVQHPVLEWHGSWGGPAPISHSRPTSVASRPTRTARRGRSTCATSGDDRQSRTRRCFAWLASGASSITTTRCGRAAPGESR
jgi:hypothetical protein